MKPLRLAVALLLLLATPASAQTAPRFANGLPQDPAFFPIAVWLQAPQAAARYRELGINLYIGLWQGPTREQIDALAEAGMPVICEQNEVGLAHGGRTIVGWMHVDEPDNAQAAAIGYGPPIPPADIAARYESMHRADPTRPVFLNLGQGAAWDGWHGRGSRTNRPEDYPEYLKGCDIACFDIYPVTHTHADVRGRLEWVARGVQRLREGCRDAKPVWACIETTHIDNPNVRPTAQQIEAEVWIAICSGASGIVYFAHEFAPAFVEAGLLRHADAAAAVRAVNAEVQRLAPVLNSKPLRGAATVAGAPGDEFAVRAHHHDGTLHVFVASLQSRATKATVTVPGHGAREHELIGYGHAHLTFRDGDGR